MRTRILVIAMVAALVSNGAMIATAMAGPGFGGWGDGEQAMERSQNRSEKRMERMAEVLELSEDQQTQIRALHEAARAENEPLREQLAAGHEKVQELGRADLIDEQAIRDLLASQVDAKTAMIVSRAKVRSETMKLLTPEQRELAEKLEPRHGPKGKGKRGF